jgi:diketogulonate reductase-like aldo/keto reductase
MAYSPVAHKTDEQKGMFNDRTFKVIAAEHGATPAQIALAWVLREPDLIAIPKASRADTFARIALRRIINLLTTISKSWTRFSRLQNERYRSKCSDVFSVAQRSIAEFGSAKSRFL